MTARPTLRILTVWLLCATLAAFGQSATEEASQPKLTFRGEPVVLPLECQEEHLLRAGLVCNDVTPCTLVLELVAIGGLGDRIFVMGNVHASTGTVSSVLLASEDGGTTWTEPIERISGGSLEIFRSVGSGSGWIGGQQWEADSSPIPFLLATRNGGDRWSRRDVWEQDDRNGIVLGLDFETESHGYLVIERTNTDADPFELYETRTAGSSWGIRELSSEEPEIPFEVVQAAESRRLRGDSSNGAYWIEEKQGDDWKPLAAFAPHVGTCNNMERGDEKALEGAGRTAP
ncbi:MAG: hypothetical protein O2968_07545 [Acidobacteria bacterium]|nr:hypothetical protein [Acidobacteriota bacterium]